MDYQERKEHHDRWTDRIISSSGDWSGNIYDFYFKVYNKLTQDIKTPFFNLIDIGERSGSGIPSIFSVWNQNGFEEPQLIENFEPERIKLKLSFHKIGDKKSATNSQL